MSCPNCGAPHAHDARYCAACGASLVHEADPVPPLPNAGVVPSMFDLGGTLTVAPGFSGYYPCSAVKLLLMSVFTFEIYLVYWFYQQWKREQDRTREIFTPLARALFAVVFVYSLASRIRDAAAAFEVRASYSPAVMAVLFVGLSFMYRLPDPYWLLTFLAAVTLIPLQNVANEITRKIDPASERRRDFSKRELALMLPGAILIALALLGSALPEPQ
jgi:hypothetical protein